MKFHGLLYFLLCNWTSYNQLKGDLDRWKKNIKQYNMQGNANKD